MLSDKSLINNRYIVLEKIGSGGMGSVYLALDTLKDRMPIAIKCIRTDIARRFSNFSIDVFKNEYEIMTRLKHPNLTQVYDFGKSDKEYFIVIEYLQGILLNEYKGKGKIDIMVQILRALEYIHSRNIIYADIKPGNIMIIEDKVKLLDFGISRLIVKKKEEKIRGTVLYFSPDILKGDISFSSDIFSLGLVFFEFITGRKFFDINTEDIISELLTSWMLDDPKI